MMNFVRREIWNDIIYLDGAVKEIINLRNENLMKV